MDRKPQRPVSAEGRKLIERISEISEDCYCAGWMHDIEHVLWRVLETDKSIKYGFGSFNWQLRTELRDLARAANGWPRWFDETDDYSAGPALVSFDDQKFMNLFGVPSEALTAKTRPPKKVRRHESVDGSC